MNSWTNPWWNMLKPPFSGDLTQDISPMTNWWSPQIELNFAGNRHVETAVVRDVASYGKQLGIISDVLLQLTENDNSKAVEQLRKVTAEIEAVKQKQLTASLSTLKSGLLTLKSDDPEGFKQLMADLEQL